MDEDEELKLRNERWKVVEIKIYEAFKDVRFGNGIGLYEASAIDDYLKPEDSSYQEEKARDEREDWAKLLPLFEDSDGYNSNYCFMDVEGLHFFLPVMLLRFWNSTNFFFSDVDKVDSRSFKLWQHLTNEQRKVVIALFEFEIDILGTLDYYMNREEENCESCGRILCEGPLTYDEAMEKLEGDENYMTLQKLKKIYKS